jgi:hypothetical protein
LVHGAVVSVTAYGHYNPGIGTRKGFRNVRNYIEKLRERKKVFFFSLIGDIF